MDHLFKDITIAPSSNNKKKDKWQPHQNKRRLCSRHVRRRYASTKRKFFTDGDNAVSFSCYDLDLPRRVSWQIGMYLLSSTINRYSITPTAMISALIVSFLSDGFFKLSFVMFLRIYLSVKNCIKIQPHILKSS